MAEATEHVARPEGETTLPWLNHTVWGMAGTRFLSDLGHEAQSTILPTFMTSIHAGARGQALQCDGLFSAWIAATVPARSANDPIYLDHTAKTPLLPEVVEAMLAPRATRAKKAHRP
jgi:hypothetical protein